MKKHPDDFFFKLYIPFKLCINRILIKYSKFIEKYVYVKVNLSKNIDQIFKKVG
jgi:hypothetical protein